MTNLEKAGVIAAIAVPLIVGAAWLGRLEGRVDQLEQETEMLAMGPRGASCQTIVQKLVENPTDPALIGLADKWGCSDMPALSADRDALVNAIGPELANQLAPPTED